MNIDRREDCVDDPQQVATIIKNIYHEWNLAGREDHVHDPQPPTRTLYLKYHWKRRPCTRSPTSNEQVATFINNTVP